MIEALETTVVAVHDHKAVMWHIRIPIVAISVNRDGNRLPIEATEKALQEWSHDSISREEMHDALDKLVREAVMDLESKPPKERIY